LPQIQPKEESYHVVGPEIRTGHAGGGIFSIFKNRELLWAFVHRDLKNRYVGGVLGVLWTIVTPLAELIIYSFVFHGLMGVRFQPTGGWGNYALFLFSGMVTWLAFSDGLSHASSSITSHAHLLKKLHFPLLLLPAHIVLSTTLNQAIRLGVLLLVILLLGGGLSWTVLLVPFVLILQVAFTLGLAFLLSTTHVYFRDTHHWVSTTLLMWMFITPVFYPAASYPVKYTLLLQLNPMAHLVGMYRELILNQNLPHPNSVIIFSVVSLMSLVVGYSVFHHHQNRFGDYA
jgi:lipopolysaccharide transport system permease protein